jgi:hypothetical protein
MSSGDLKMLSLIHRNTMENNFNIKEYALNGVTDRKHFYKLNELPEVTGKKDIYAFRYKRKFEGSYSEEVAK